MYRRVKRDYREYKEKSKREKHKGKIMGNIMKLNADDHIQEYINTNECVICLCMLSEMDTFRNFECNRHLVHMECYNAWRKSNTKHNCPLCQEED